MGKNYVGYEKTRTIKIPLYIIVIIIVVIAVGLIVGLSIYNTVSGIIGSDEKNNVKISCDKTTIDVGEKINITMEGTTEDTYLISSNPEIILISGNEITGVSVGEADIYAVTGDRISNIITINCIVSLKDIILKDNEIVLKTGEQKKLLVKPDPINATNKKIIAKSLNNEIATYSHGMITGVTVGETYIVVTDEITKIEKKCKIIVKPIEVEEIYLDESDVQLGVGQKYILLEDVQPDNAVDKSVKWTSSNNDVVTVDSGEIKAVGEGKATITVMAKNGVKANCKITVTQTPPTYDTKYASSNFNIRVKPEADSKIISSVEINDEIEVLKENSNWAKVRVRKNGLVGYTISKAYSSSKTYYIKNVPFLNQNSLGYPTGCEAVSATMAARFAGYDVDVSTIVNNTPTDTQGKRQETKTYMVDDQIVEETIWVAENPFKYFVGHPVYDYSQGSYGCYAGPIVTSLQSIGIPCTDISGCSIETLYSYIQQGKPVVVWCKKDAGDLTQGVTWHYPDGSGEYVELVGEHCAVLIGYDGDKVYLNDPAAGEGVTQPKWKFESNWYQLHSQALVIN